MSEPFPEVPPEEDDPDTDTEEQPEDDGDNGAPGDLDF